MKILVVSHDGLASDLVKILQEEGHEVLFNISTFTCLDIMDGLVEKVHYFADYINSVDLIIFDDVGFGKFQTTLRKNNYNVVGSSEWGDKIEEDRDFGEEIANKIGMKTPETFEFDDFDEAINHIKENKGQWIVKFNGKVANNKELLYLSEKDDSSDLISILTHYKNTWNKNWNVDFILSRKVEGIEMAVGAYFDGEKFVENTININFEHKRLCNSDLGCMTGEMGTVIKFCEKSEMKLFNETLKKLENDLKESDYQGCIDINCIIDKEGTPWFVEFTSRFGYPALNIEAEGLKGWGDFLYSLSNGEGTAETDKSWLIGVVLAVPPFPYNARVQFDRLSKESPIILDDLNEEEKTHVHYGDVKSKDGSLCIGGDFGYALIVTNKGKTIKEAQEKAYEICKKIVIPNKFYRTDIGDRVIKDLEELKKLGYL